MSVSKQAAMLRSEDWDVPEEEDWWQGGSRLLQNKDDSPFAAHICIRDTSLP